MSTAAAARPVADDGYLMCGVGACRILIATSAIVRISEVASAPGEAQSSEQQAPQRLDLGALPGVGPGEQPGIQRPSLDIRFGAATRRLEVDWVGKIEQVAPAEFIELPAVFELACQYFDAVCARPFEGAHALRLARTPPAGWQDQTPVAPL